MDPREKNLPQWAQTIINDLRQRIDISRDPLFTEVVRLRPQVELLKARNEALTYLLQCAARGEHEMSQNIISILEDFDLVLKKKEG